MIYIYIYIKDVYGYIISYHEYNKIQSRYLIFIIFFFQNIESADFKMSILFL